MARRVTWTNNSTSYDGTEAYRDTTIDPQNLPEPIATVDPVAQGATVEYIDLTGSGDQCYAVRDFDSAGDGALSEAYCYEKISPFDDAQIGDEIEGGTYAGQITYADGRTFHLVIALSGMSSGKRRYGYDGIVTGADDPDDGFANHLLIMQKVADGDDDNGYSPDAFLYCDAYSADGYDDWYLPAMSEAQKIMQNFSDNVLVSSTEVSSIYCKRVYFASGAVRTSDIRKYEDGTIGGYALPTRRVAA